MKDLRITCVLTLQHVNYALGVVQGKLGVLARLVDPAPNEIQQAYLAGELAQLSCQIRRLREALIIPN